MGIVVESLIIIDIVVLVRDVRGKHLENQWFPILIEIFIHFTLYRLSWFSRLATDAQVKRYSEFIIPLSLNNDYDVELFHNS